MPTNIREEEDWGVRRVTTPRVGAVIVFKEEITPAQAQQMLDILVTRGLIEIAYANEYDASYGGPVWYIP